MKFLALVIFLGGVLAYRFYSLTTKKLLNLEMQSIDQEAHYDMDGVSYDPECRRVVVSGMVHSEAM